MNDAKTLQSRRQSESARFDKFNFGETCFLFALAGMIALQSTFFAVVLYAAACDVANAFP